MRTIGKITGSLFALIVVVSLFSMIVSAAPTVVTSGSVNNTYDYVLYSDGELKLSLSKSAMGFSFSLDKIGAEYLKSVKTVTVDCSLLKDYSATVSLEGCDCPATRINTIFPSTRQNRVSFHFVDFPKVSGENISFPQNIRFDTVYLSKFNGIKSADFLNNFPDTYYVMLHDCDSLKKDLKINCKNIMELALHSSDSLESVDLSGSTVKTIYITACCNVSEAYFPDCSEIVHIYGSDKMKAFYLPAGLKEVNKECFTNCKSLTDIYYPGTKEQLDKVTVFDLDHTSQHVVLGTFTSITGNMKIHYFNGVRKGWVNNDNGTWSYLDSRSHLVKGWFQSGKSWYYFDTKGIMLTNWQEIDFNWYYLGSNGVMRTGWQQIGGKWYYFDSTGFMYLGWKSVGGKWYYFENSGAMKTGWLKDDGKWYFLKSDGSMASNEYCDGYWFNKDGSWTYMYRASWRKDSKGWWYGDDSGWYAKNNTYKIDGKYYSFDSNGYLK